MSEWWVKTTSATKWDMYQENYNFFYINVV